MSTPLTESKDQNLLSNDPHKVIDEETRSIFHHENSSVIKLNNQYSIIDSNIEVMSFDNYHFNDADKVTMPIVENK